MSHLDGRRLTTVRGHAARQTAGGAAYRPGVHAVGEAAGAPREAGGRGVQAGAAVLAALSLLVAACSTLTASPSSRSSGAPLAARTTAASFTASGRVAARVVGDSPRGFSGGFAWTHAPADDTVELLTPLGQLAARMRVTAGGADVQLSDGTKTFAADPERYLSDALGLPLPLSAMPSWLQAVPVAGIAYRAETDAVGRPTTLWQSGWEVQYGEYADASVGARPIRIRLSQGDVEARMIVSEWQAGTPP